MKLHYWTEATGSSYKRQSVEVAVDFKIWNMENFISKFGKRLADSLPICYRAWSGFQSKHPRRGIK